jgi:glycosyltransferase involved in cell wall biosynthesis
VKPLVLVCGVKIPFSHGGAEMLVESLCEALAARGCEVDTVLLPFSWNDRLGLVKSALAWRLIDLTEVAGRRVDRVIATRFPSYLVKHPDKVVWLVHQLRQAYDLLGTPHSDFKESDPRERAILDTVRAMDRRTLSEARRLFSISANTAERLRRFNQLEAEVLYPPPKLAGALRAGEPGDYVFSLGRLDRMKRFDLLIRALKHCQTAVRVKLAGSGPESESLAELAGQLGVASRVDFLGWADDQAVVDLYASCLAVFYAPYDEDYGYVTVEAFRAGKPVVTTSDAGGVLEFVADGVNGFVCPPDAPKEIAARLDQLFRDRQRARTLGEAGRAKVETIGWDEVVDKLLA